MADATWRTWFRMGWSRRRLLEWTTAAQASAGTKGSVDHYVRLCGVGSSQRCWPWKRASSAATGTSLSRRSWPRSGSPHRSWPRWVCVPYNSAELTASHDDVTALRLVARRTWRYFEEHVTSLDHDLPPDNFQEDRARRCPSHVADEHRPLPPLDRRRPGLRLDRHERRPRAHGAHDGHRRGSRSSQRAPVELV